MLTAQRTGIVTLVLGISAVAASPAYANPNLTQGVWQDITPPVITKGAPDTCIGQGVAFDPKNRSTIYWGTTPYTEEDGGLFKSTDAGSTWARIAKVTPEYQGASDHLDMPLHIRVDPNDSNHIYAGDGVRGSSTGFFVSTDGGVNFVLPAGLTAALKAATIGTQDVYDVAADPTDFKHVLVSFHSAWGWTDTKWNMDAGVLESKDGGTTWIVHEPRPGWGAGHSIKFLYNPALNIGNSQTWLLGTQGAGFWRTTDAGTTWTKVSSNNITHGGGTIYYTHSGALYASGETMRSMDNGATWSSVGQSATWCVYGDGKTLYTGKSFGADQPFSISPETDGAAWAPFNTQKFPDGPYEMAYDAVNGIMYSSNWSSGVWALKVGPGDPDAGVGTGAGGSTGASGSAGAGGSTGASGSTGAGGATVGGGRGAGGATTVGGGAGPTSTPPPSSGSGGSASNGTGGSANIYSPADTTSATNDAGCSCRVSTASDSWAAVPLVGLSLALAFLRRRSV